MLTHLTSLLGLGPLAKTAENQKGEQPATDFASIFADVEGDQDADRSGSAPVKGADSIDHDAPEPPSGDRVADADSALDGSPVAHADAPGPDLESMDLKIELHQEFPFPEKDLTKQSEFLTESNETGRIVRSKVSDPDGEATETVAPERQSSELPVPGASRLINEPAEQVALPHAAAFPSRVSDGRLHDLPEGPLSDRPSPGGAGDQADLTGPQKGPARAAEARVEPNAAVTLPAQGKALAQGLHISKAWRAGQPGPGSIPEQRDPALSASAEPGQGPLRVDAGSIGRNKTQVLPGSPGVVSAAANALPGLSPTAEREPPAIPPVKSDLPVFRLQRHGLTRLAEAEGSAANRDRLNNSAGRRVGDASMSALVAEDSGPGAKVATALKPSNEIFPNSMTGKAPETGLANALPREVQGSAIPNGRSFARHPEAAEILPTGQTKARLPDGQSVEPVVDPGPKGWRRPQAAHDETMIVPTGRENSGTKPVVAVASQPGSMIGTQAVNLAFDAEEVIVPSGVARVPDVSVEPSPSSKVAISSHALTQQDNTSSIPTPVRREEFLGPRPGDARTPVPPEHEPQPKPVAGAGPATVSEGLPKVSYADGPMPSRRSEGVLAVPEGESRGPVVSGSDRHPHFAVTNGGGLAARVDAAATDDGRRKVMGVVTSPRLADVDADDLDLAIEFHASGPVQDGRTSPQGLPQTAGLTRPDAQQVLRQVAEAVTRLTDGSIDIRLSPEELGNVRLQLVQGEHALTVHITADRPETLELMRRHIDQLARDLADAGYGGAEFSFGDDGGNDRGARQQSPEDRAAVAPRDPVAPSNTPKEPVHDGLDLRI